MNEKFGSCGFGYYLEIHNLLVLVFIGFIMLAEFFSRFLDFLFKFERFDDAVDR